MASFGDADAAFAAGPPFLPVAEPALFLFVFARGAFGGVGGDADAFDALRLGGGLVGGGEEAGVGGDQARRASEFRPVDSDGRGQQAHIARPPIVDFIVGDDLVFRLLQLHHLAELVGLAGLALADDFRRRLEHAQELAVAAGVAAEDAGAGLLHHLLDQRHHRLDLVTQAVERELRQHAGGLFDAGGDLAGEALGLADHAARRIEQMAIGPLEPVLAGLGFGARRPRDPEHAQLDAAAAVAQGGAGRAGNRGHLLHRADQHPHPVAEQA